MWLSGGLCSAGLMVGLDLKDVSHLKKGSEFQKQGPICPLERGEGLGSYFSAVLTP